MSASKDAARKAQDSTAFRVAARVGYVVLGLLHLVIGAIAISIATGAGGGEADQSGAMQQIREAPAGVFALWAVVVGLAALAAWQIAEALLERDPDTKKAWAHRVKYLGTAVTYLAIGFTAAVFAAGGSSDSEDSASSFSQTLMAAPAGVFLVGLVGLVILGIGVAFVFRGVTRKFEENLSLPGGAARKVIVAFGVAGYVAKGIAIGVAGILFLAAAVTHDPEAAGGLDAALKALVELPFGPAVLWVVGVGLILYGLFSIARARYARM